MALIGQGAIPVPIDYSRWADMTARSSQATAAAVGGLAQQLGGIVEDRREKKDQIKAAEAKGKAVKELFGDQGGFLDSFLATMSDEELPLSERSAMAGEVNGLIAAGIDKFNTERQFGLQERGLGMEQQRIDLDREGKQADAYQAQTQQQFANESALSEAANRYAQIAEMEAPLSGKIPDMSGSSALIESLLKQGDGPSALAAVKSYEDKRIKQMEPLMTKPAGKRLSQIGVQTEQGPAMLDVFVSPDGQVESLEGELLNPSAFMNSEGVLPPMPGDGPVGPPERRTMPMPQLGFRPTPGADPLDTEKKALEIAKLKGDIASTERKESDLKQAASQNAQETVTLIDSLQKHPGLQAAVGTGFSKTVLRQGEAIAGTDRAGAEAIIAQLRGRAFLDEVQQLRGLGPLSDAEGAKLQQAAARLDPNQSEDDFKAALAEMRQSALRLGEAAQKEGGTPAAPQKSAADILREQRAKLQGR